MIRKITYLCLFLFMILSVQAQDVLTKDTDSKPSKNSIEVLFSPEYLSMSNIMFKSGDSDIFKVRSGILFHSSTLRTNVLNQIGQFNLGIQLNKMIYDNVNIYGFLDAVGFNRFDSFYLNNGNEIKTEQLSGIGAQLGFGFDLNLNEIIYFGVESGAMIPYDQEVSGLKILLSANSGLRLGFRF